MRVIALLCKTPLDIKAASRTVLLQVLNQTLKIPLNKNPPKVTSQYSDIKSHLKK